MRIKITDHKSFVRLLKEHGFNLERTGKHDKWTNGDKSVIVSKKHAGRFSRMLAERLAKELGIL